MSVLLFGCIRVAEKQHFQNFAKHEIWTKLFGIFPKYREISRKQNHRFSRNNFAKFTFKLSEIVENFFKLF